MAKRMVRLLLGWIRAWRSAPFLFRRSAVGRQLARGANALHFRFGRVTYTQRERFDAARLGSQSAWALLRWATVPFALAVLALIVFGTGPFVYGRLASRFSLPVLVRFPPVDPQSFSAIVGTTAQAAAAVLALFFAAISVVASTAYAKISTEVRSLIAQDPLNRRYLRLLAHVTATALGAGAMQAAGYAPSAALLWYLFATSGVCMAAFLPLGIRTFALFDPDSLSIYPSRTFSRVLRSVEVSGHRWLDPSFQNHANQLASSQLDLLDDLVAFAIAEERPRNDAIVALVRQVLRLGAYYSTRKHRVPSDSLWFTKKAEFRRWEVSDSTATEIAIQTGGTPAPERVPDFSFVESRIAGMLKQSLNHLLSVNALDDIATVMIEVGHTTNTFAKHFGQVDAMDCSVVVRNVLLERLKVADPAMDPLKYVQLVDLIGYTAIAPILYTPLAITERSVNDLLDVASPVLRLERTALSRQPQPRKVLQDAEDLINRLRFERIVEGEVRTATWYVRQILALAWASYIREVIKNLALIVEREFLTPAKDLVAKQRPMWAAVWLQRGIEACHKAKDRIRALEKTYSELNVYQIAELKWEPSGADAAVTRIEGHRIEIVRLLASIVPVLATVRSDSSLPDVVGPARAWISDELVSMMERKQETGFRELFAAYFAASLATHDDLLKQMRDTGREYYGHVAMDTLLDIMDASGLALLFSELDGSSFAEHVRAIWDSFISGANDAAATIKALYLAIDVRLDGPLFSASAMRRQEWGRRFGAALENRGVATERDFDPFSGRSPARHSSVVIDSLSFLYGHPMTEAHDYFCALYLASRPEASGIQMPHSVKDAVDSIQLARGRAENPEDEPSDPNEVT